MLVLSRKSGERILVGDDIVITIVRIGPNTVRLGIEAPGHLNIVREELCTTPEAETADVSLAPASQGYTGPGPRSLPR